jgi:hypothetical protein
MPHEKKIGFHHALGSQLLDAMKAHLTGLITQGLSHAQVTAQHKVYVKE